ncbi:MAG: hypothetical protein UW10_C0019G0002 [Candidatus Magasanikbacteria bacterium GW2011_GWA2_43_9]|nr:MAG: hypothetical protein UW10_C0019G0002 [Candidatus Magasanikbacteria bacterium GW2011_GWA2_43_9]
MVGVTYIGISQVLQPTSLWGLRERCFHVILFDFASYCLRIGVSTECRGHDLHATRAKKNYDFGGCLVRRLCFASLVGSMGWQCGILLTYAVLHEHHHFSERLAVLCQAIDIYA